MHLFQGWNLCNLQFQHILYIWKSIFKTSKSKNECPHLTGLTAGCEKARAFSWCKAAYVWFPSFPPPSTSTSTLPSSALRGDRAGMVEGWGVFSPIMPSGTITPVTFRDLTFSPGGVERRGAVGSGRTGWAIAISPVVLVTAAAPAATTTNNSSSSSSSGTFILCRSRTANVSSKSHDYTHKCVTICKNITRVWILGYYFKSLHKTSSFVFFHPF